MGIENRAGQTELKERKSDFVPFVDSQAVEEAARSIVDGMYKIRHRAGEVIYPYPLSPREERGVRQLVREVHGNLVYRVEEFTPIRLEEGMGTVISIREKGRR